MSIFYVSCLHKIFINAIRCVGVGIRIIQLNPTGKSVAYRFRNSEKIILAALYDLLKRTLLVFVLELYCIFVLIREFV